MKRKQILAVMMAGVLLAQGLLMTGCAGGQSAAPGIESQAGGTPETQEQKDVSEQQDTSEERNTAASEETAEKTDGVNGFAFRLTDILLSDKEKGSNLLVSPYSVWLPLAALANATDEAAFEELMDALGQTGMTAEELNQAVRALNRALTQEERAEYSKAEGLEFESPLKMANALFVSKYEKPDAAFSGLFEESFGGKIFAVDFLDQSSAEQVNQWAVEHTDGKIMEIIDSFDPDTVAAIANALYFSDSWATQFSEDNTQAGVFHGASFDEDVFFMNHKFTQNTYYEDDTLQAAVLPTTNNGQMILLLPREGKSAEDALSEMDDEKLQAVLSGDYRTVQLSMPKFMLSSGIFSVKEALDKLGVPLTDDQNPHLSGLVEGGPLYISEAVQKAVMEVDENGLMAAAVTVMGIERMSIPVETEPVELNFDRPFAFILTADGGSAGQQVLFTGVVNTTMTAVACE